MPEDSQPRRLQQTTHKKYNNLMTHRCPRLRSYLRERVCHNIVRGERTRCALAMLRLDCLLGRRGLRPVSASSATRAAPSSARPSSSATPRAPSATGPAAAARGPASGGAISHSDLNRWEARCHGPASSPAPLAEQKSRMRGCAVGRLWTEWSWWSRRRLQANQRLTDFIVLKTLLQPLTQGSNDALYASKSRSLCCSEVEGLLVGARLAKQGKPPPKTLHTSFDWTVSIMADATANSAKAKRETARTIVSGHEFQ